MNIKHTEIFEKAIRFYGKKLQLRQAQEESAELIVSVSHYLRNPSAENRLALCYEVADMEIMLKQIQIILDSDSIINDCIAEKTKCLELRLMMEKEKMARSGHE